MRNTALFVGATLAMASSGCFSTWDLAPRSLVALNGYHEPEKIPLTDTRGDELEFDRITELRFIDSSGAPSAKAKFSSIQVNGSTFTGAVRPDGRPLAIDLTQVSAVQAKRYSALKTGLAIGIPVGVVTIVSIVAATAVIVAAARVNVGP
jgi:hypothetical protein